MGENCTSTCITKDHATWGECQRSKNVGVNYTGINTVQRKKDNELSRYKSAIKNGIEPRSTQIKDIVAAERLSDKAGRAFDGINLKFK
jgi:hypothetical protein